MTHLRKDWRTGRDSNPRYGFPYAAFRVRCFQPLSHLSAAPNQILKPRPERKPPPGQVRPIPVFEAAMPPEWAPNAGSRLACQPVESRFGPEQRQDKIEAGAHLWFELPGRIDYQNPRRRQFAVYAAGPDDIDPEHLGSARS